MLGLEYIFPNAGSSDKYLIFYCSCMIDSCEDTTALEKGYNNWGTVG